MSPISYNPRALDRKAIAALRSKCANLPSPDSIKQARNIRFASWAFILADLALAAIIATAIWS